MAALISIGIVLLVLVAVLLVHAALKPNVFRVERSLAIAAPPERIFPRIDDFHQWASWSPYEKLDPAMTRTFGGASSGTGATYAWKGNAKAGEGRMAISEATPPGRIVIQLEFLKPFAARNVGEFTLVPSGPSTTVTWAMHGPQPFRMRVMCTFIDMDRLVGRDFEAGLANLKRLSEAPAVDGHA